MNFDRSDLDRLPEPAAGCSLSTTIARILHDWPAGTDARMARPADDSRRRLPAVEHDRRIRRGTHERELPADHRFGVGGTMTPRLSVVRFPTSRNAD